jgi:predicted ATPase
MRRLVAEGKMKVDDLAIYYVDYDEERNESSLKRIVVDNGGGVEWWPDGIFSETAIETKAIYNAQLNDLKNVDRNK